MPVKQQEHLAPPLKISAVMQQRWSNQVLKTAVELDLFTSFKDGGLTSDELAKKHNLNSKACKLLLDALVAMEYFTKSGDKYSLTDVAQTYLVKDSKLYMGDYVLFRDVVDQGWQQLTETVKTGKPYTRVNEQEIGEQFFQKLAANIFPMGFSTAQSVAEELKIAGKQGPVRVLDLAAGSGVWSIPLAMNNPNVTVDALDFPPVLEVTKRFATRFDVESRYNYLAGDWHHVKLESDHYDFIMLGHILHSEGKEESERLLAHCTAALKKGGSIVVAEFLENEDRTGPLFPTLFALNMMLATSGGCVFTQRELAGLMTQAGLHDVKRLTLPFYGDESPVMMGTK